MRPVLRIAVLLSLLFGAALPVCSQEQDSVLISLENDSLKSEKTSVFVGEGEFDLNSCESLLKEF